MKNVVFKEQVSELAKKDILELQTKISGFQAGQSSDEAFRKYRLARGVYGQRQPGVQMIRIKLPYGKLTADQLDIIANCADTYATGNLHATTRQDIQLHFVKLSDAPQLWADLENARITLKEACGNTVRNVTASPTAGIDPEEPFDVSPYAQAIFKYLLRNPICQEMGRKFKIALSSSDRDTAFGFMHDVGLIPKIRIAPNGKEHRGFRVLVGGGLGAQPLAAQQIYEFLEEDYIIPLIEAIIRVFDRNGERTRRNKARMKYLLHDIGLMRFMELIEEEWPSLKNKVFRISNIEDGSPIVRRQEIPPADVPKDPTYQQWRKTNVFEQKQKGWFAVQIRLLLGDMPADKARGLSKIVRRFAADDIRVTANQGYLLRYIREEHLPNIFRELDALDLAEPGFDSTMDITTCPGTDTCNLAITSSYGITKVLETLMKNEFSDLIYNRDIKIKISGCMNGCGQHGAANIGFHGSSLKSGNLILPALQVLLAGGFSGGAEGQLAEKVIKVPAKRGPDVLRTLLKDFEMNSIKGEYFNQYYTRQGKPYFYSLLKPLANLTSLEPSDFKDWDHDQPFQTEVGIGECAGVVIDLVATTLSEAKEKHLLALETLKAGNLADAVYHGYNAFVTGAKALLLGESIQTNTQRGILKAFDENFGEYFCPNPTNDGFSQLVLAINKNDPNEEFAHYYVDTAGEFLQYVKVYRERQLSDNKQPAVREVVYGLDS